LYLRLVNIRVEKTNKNSCFCYAKKTRKQRVKNFCQNAMFSVYAEFYLFFTGPLEWLFEFFGFVTPILKIWFLIEKFKVRKLHWFNKANTIHKNNLRVQKQQSKFKFVKPQQLLIHFCSIFAPTFPAWIQTTTENVIKLTKGRIFNSWPGAFLVKNRNGMHLLVFGIRGPAYNISFVL
jgi:hypothetical protein